MEEIIADRMTPKHATPKPAVGIELVKDVILPAEPDQAIGIIDPTGLSHEVVFLPHNSCRHLSPVIINMLLRMCNGQGHTLLGHFRFSFHLVK